MDEIPDLGMESDAKIRVERAREDTASRREKVERARQSIYKEGYVVNSTHVEKELKAESLVPTTVRAIIVKCSTVDKC